MNEEATCQPWKLCCSLPVLFCEALHKAQNCGSALLLPVVWKTQRKWAIFVSSPTSLSLPVSLVVTAILPSYRSLCYKMHIWNMQQLYQMNYLLWGIFWYTKGNIPQTNLFCMRYVLRNSYTLSKFYIESSCLPTETCLKDHSILLMFTFLKYFIPKHKCYIK